jgi:hypothetical protein
MHKDDVHGIRSLSEPKTPVEQLTATERPIRKAAKYRLSNGDPPQATGTSGAATISKPEPE